MRERIVRFLRTWAPAFRRILRSRWLKPAVIAVVSLSLFFTGFYLGLRSALNVWSLVPPGYPPEGEMSGNDHARAGLETDQGTDRDANAKNEVSVPVSTSGPVEATGGANQTDRQDTEAAGDTHAATTSMAGPSSTARALAELSPPVEGDVYRREGFHYWESFSEWRYHDGVDFRVPEGEPVRAALSGFVRETYTDIRLGTVVEIEHESGVVTVYGCLEPRHDIIPGTRVEQGEVLGWISGSGPREGDSQPHLHFKVQFQGKLLLSDSYLKTR